MKGLLGIEHSLIFVDSDTISMVEEVLSLFAQEGNIKIAKQQSAYMKNKFAFFGIKSPTRKEIQRPFLEKKNLPEKGEGFNIVENLWMEPQRELHYFAMELMYRYRKEFEKEDLHFIEELILQNSWWDSIDFIAPKILGEYFLRFPKERKHAVDRWILSDNIWLQRSAILFQLKYKDSLDKDLLTYVIDQLKDEKEFFIRKAIGWVLREYSKVNPVWVKEFVLSNELQPLSEKEALKYIMKNVR